MNNDSDVIWAQRLARRLGLAVGLMIMAYLITEAFLPNDHCRLWVTAGAGLFGFCLPAVAAGRSEQL